MKKWIILMIMVAMAIPVSYGALDTCEDFLLPGNNCTMITPSLNCTVYDYTIYNTSGLVQNFTNLTFIGSNIYKLSFNQSAGDYIVQFCDGATKQIYVRQQFKMVAFIIGAVGISLLLLYFAFNIDREHWLLKLVTLMFFAGALNIIPGLLISNVNISSQQALLTVTTWFFRVFSMYVFVYFIWTVLNQLKSFQKFVEKTKWRFKIK